MTIPHSGSVFLRLRVSFVCSFALPTVCCLLTCTADGETKTKPVYDVLVSNRFRYESDATGPDTDLWQYVSASARGLLDGHLDLRLSGLVDYDLNGDDDIDSAYDQTWPRVHEASLDLHDYGALSHLIVGRQVISDVDYLHFDGLSLSLWDGGKLSVFGFGGRPVSYYSGNGGEWLAGAGLRWRVLPTTEVQVDGYGIDDGGGDTVASAVRVRQYFPSGLGNTVEARWIDDELRDASLRLYYGVPGKFDVTGRVYWQAMDLGVDTQTLQSRYFSMYSGFLSPAERHISVSLNATTYLGEHYSLNFGGAYKVLSDNDSEGGENFTNIDSSRVNAGLSIADLPVPGLTIDMYGSYYRHPEEDLYDLTAEIGYRFSPTLRANCGVTHARYDFSDYYFFLDRFDQLVPDPSGGKQRSDSIYVGVHYEPSARWRISVRAEYEDVDRMENAYLIALRLDYRFRSWPGT